MNNIKIDTIRSIEYTDASSFFYQYLVLQRPFHNLSDLECLVLANLYRKRHELSKVVLDSSVLDMLVLNKESRKEVRERCAMDMNRFNVILVKLRKRGLVSKNYINTKYMPSMSFKEGNVYKLLYTFTPKYNGEVQEITEGQEHHIQGEDSISEGNQ